jgi:hypothetical protein
MILPTFRALLHTFALFTNVSVTKIPSNFCSDNWSRPSGNYKYLINNSLGVVSGVDIDILDMLKKKFGFRYKMMIGDSFDIGRLPNGTLIGFFKNVRYFFMIICSALAI